MSACKADDVAYREAVMSKNVSVIRCRFACSDRVHLSPSQMV